MKREDFWTHVAIGQPEECWPWDRAKTGAGYGMLRLDGTNRYAHRTAYELVRGPIPRGAHILHSCDNPPCCNPAHLSIGSRSDNMRDCVAKGRQNHPSSAKTHCKRGHEFTTENTFYAVDGSRQCLECRRARGRKYDAARRAKAL